MTMARCPFHFVCLLIVLALAVVPLPQNLLSQTPPSDETSRLADITRSLDLVREAENRLQRIDQRPSWHWEDEIENVRKQLHEALKLDENNEKAKAILDELDALKTRKLAEHNRLLDEKTWPGPYDQFKGRGNIDRLAREAYDFLRNDPQWKKENPIAVVVRGDWISVDPLAGLHMEYALPIWVAMRPDRNSDVAWVYPMTVHTQTKRGVDQGPPFVKAKKQLHGEFQMRPDNVPAMPRLDQGIGFIGLLLVLANFIAGIMLIQPWIENKTSALDGLYEVLETRQAGVGMTILIIGGLSLLGRVLTFSPAAWFDHLLPQFSAIVAGIFFARILWHRKIAPLREPQDEEPQFKVRTKADKTSYDLDQAIVGPPVEIAMEEVEQASIPLDEPDSRLTGGFFGRIEAVRVYLGFTCLVLAGLHVLFGGLLPLV